MMSPDAGGTDQVSQNRSYVAIPEVGDQVMVGFVHNHPDRPVVMGGMFHGGTGLGGGAQNHMRSIQTKSGIKVLMNDNEKSVTILDPSGNIYFMDGAGNISVTAPNDINFTAGANLNISVGQNMTTDDNWERKWQMPTLNPAYDSTDSANSASKKDALEKFKNLQLTLKIK